MGGGGGGGGGKGGELKKKKKKRGKEGEKKREKMKIKEEFHKHTFRIPNHLFLSRLKTYTNPSSPDTGPPEGIKEEREEKEEIEEEEEEEEEEGKEGEGEEEGVRKTDVSTSPLPLQSTISTIFRTP